MTKVTKVQAFKSGAADAKPVKTVFQVLKELDDLDEKYELMPQRETAALVKVHGAMARESAQPMMDEFVTGMAITHKLNLTSPDEVLGDEGSMLVLQDDRVNMKVTVLSPDPVVSLSLDRDFSEWDQKMQDAFIDDVAQYLGVEAVRLVPLCASNGSIQFYIQICNILNDKFPEIKKKISTIAQDVKFGGIGAKWKLKRGAIKTWFSQKFSRSTDAELALEMTSAVKPDAEMTSLSSGEKWLLNKAEKLREGIIESLQGCSQEFEISAICALDNPAALEQFIQFDDWQQSKLLFHGTMLENLTSIFQGGFCDEFISGNTGNYGWYGKGHYFTSFPAYALAYIRENAVAEQYTLIVAYVNLGKSKTIYDRSYEGKYIAVPYQSHYAKVKNCHAIPKQQWDTVTGDVYDEYVVRTGKRVLPRFYVTLSVKKKVLVWRAAKLSNAENSGVLDYLRRSYVVYGATTSEDALQIIKKKKSKSKVYVVTNGADQSELFIQKIRYDLKVPHPIFIFSVTRASWAHVYDKYADVDYKSELLDFVKQHLLDEKYDASQGVNPSGGGVPDVGGNKTLDEVRKMNVPNKEAYLADNEFEQLFGMNKQQFYQLRPWKQKNLKKSKGIF